MYRRSFLKLIAAGSAGSSLALASEQSSTSTKAPKIVTGISAGDADQASAVIWSRTERAALMRVEVSANKQFANSSTFIGSVANEESDYNAKTLIYGLLAGQQWYYRVTFESLDHPGSFSDGMVGQFRTAPSLSRNIRFCWSGDTAGQGYGVDVSRGGMQTYKAILEQQPDFFVHCGDLIYADGPIPKERQLADNQVWHNITNPTLERVAQSTQDFRENYYYNFADQHFANLHSSMACYQTWDDHEVKNNWFPGQITTDERYTETNISTLANRGKRALFQCNPIKPNAMHPQQLYRSVNYGPDLQLFILDMRSYRGSNSNNMQQQPSEQTQLLGEQQLSWLKHALSTSDATWKIIVADMPLGLKITDWGTDISDNHANQDGAPKGREFELVELLGHIKHAEISNVHFITADVHYCASHYYHPEKAAFKEFKPFWEFVSGPLHAGTFGPNQLDNTFGPSAEFIGIPDDLVPNSPPSAGFQFFGQMDIDSKTKALTVSHYNRNGEQLWRLKLNPE